jgi:hypothetical protein
MKQSSVFEFESHKRLFFCSFAEKVLGAPPENREILNLRRTRPFSPARRKIGADLLFLH